MAWVLDRKAAASAQKLHQKRVKILRACADDDLLRLHDKPPLPRKLARNRLPQGRKPAVWDRLEEILTLIQNDASHQLCPHGKRKQLCCGTLRDLRLLRLFRQARGTDRRLRQKRHMCHKIARALARREIPLVQQLRVGRLDGDLAEAQVLGQRPLRGKLLPAGEQAG